MSGSDSLTGPAIIADVEQGQDRMAQDTDVIALVGAGDPGLAMLRALLGVPGVEVR